MKRLSDLLHMKGKSYLLCALLMTEALPLLLEATCFFYQTESLSPALRGSITLFTFCSSWLFLTLALMRNMSRPITFDTVFSSTIRTLFPSGSALYLELTLFRRLFLPEENLFYTVLALLLAALAIHTCQWTVELISAKEGSIFPVAGSWKKAWGSFFRHPLLTLAQLACGLLLLLCTDTLFPLLRTRALAGLADTLPGALGVYLLFSFLLFAAAIPLLRLSTLSLVLEGAVPGEKEKESPAEAPADLRPLRQSGAAEEALIEAGIMTREELEAQPVSIITDKEISQQERSSSVYKDHFSFFKGKKLLSAPDTLDRFHPDPAAPAIFLVLLGFLLYDGFVSAQTPEKMVSDLLETTQEEISLQTDAGRLNAAANVCLDSAVQLSALEAYLSAPDPLETPEDAARLFAETRRIASDSPLTDLLQARLLLQAGFPEHAVTLLESSLSSGMDDDRIYLLLLQAYKAAGPGYESRFRLARSICLSRQIFTDELAFLDDLSDAERAALCRTLASSREELVLEQQLLLWQASRQRGDYESAYNGLYALLSTGSGDGTGSFYSQSTKHWDNLRVLRAFVETGMEYHVRADGSDKKIPEYYRATAEAALTYDEVFIVARAAGEYTGDHTLEEVKIFVGSALLACGDAEEAFRYLSEAWVLFPGNRDLQLLYARAALAVGQDEKALSAATGVAALATESYALENVVLAKNTSAEEALRVASALSVSAIASLEQGAAGLQPAAFYASALAQLLLEDGTPQQEQEFFRFARRFTELYVLDPSVVASWQGRTLLSADQQDLFRQNKLLYHYLLTVQLWSTGQYSAALFYAETAWEQDSSLALLCWLNGEILLQIDLESGLSSADAMPWFVRALNLYPDNGRAWYGLAECRREMGLTLPASAAYRQVLRCGPHLDYTEGLYRETNYQLLQKARRALSRLGQ
ncbi:MAG: hypothetical protein IJC68_04510 [Firmicutes bacterium]|nr:hypothetical protein [Bacillota bacterium]